MAFKIVQDWLYCRCWHYKMGLEYAKWRSLVALDRWLFFEGKIYSDFVWKKLAMAIVGNGCYLKVITVDIFRICNSLYLCITMSINVTTRRSLPEVESMRSCCRQWSRLWSSCIDRQAQGRSHCGCNNLQVGKHYIV